MAAIDTVDLRDSNAAEALELALRATGFVQLVGHGLDAAVRERHREAFDAFFALPTDTKRQFVHDDPAANRGYRAKGSEALAYSLGKESPPDLFESFNAGVAPSGVSHKLLAPTPWPSDVIPELESAALDYSAALGSLAHQLDATLDEILGTDWLAQRSTSGPDTLATINYRPNPDGTEDAAPGQQRMGAHTDYTSFTLLDAEPVPGLQIIDPNGDWVDVIPDADGLLMNSGDLLAMLTNDAFASVLHRVVPMSAGSAPFRRSIAFFHYPDLDVEIAPLDRYVDGEARYAPVVVEDHLLGKLVAPKVKEVTEAASTVAGRLD